MVSKNAEPWVGVYSPEGRWLTDVIFKYKWQARLFHLLLNASKTWHAGTRHY